MKDINYPTAIVIVAGIAGVFALAYFKVDATTLATYAAAVIGLAGALRGLFHKKEEKKDGAQ